MSNPSALAAIEYEAESSFGENTTTFATLRVPQLGQVNTSGLFHKKVEPNRVVQYLNDNTQWVLMEMGGSFTMTLDLPGHGSTTAGATTIDSLATLLGFVFGAAAVSAASGTTLTGGTATVPLTTASGTFTAGSICFIGSLGDARGNGRGYAIATHVTTSLTLLNAMAGSPSNGDVLYSADTISTVESPTSAAVTGLRFRLNTANMRYECHGCYPTAVKLMGLGPAGRPQIEITWGVSWWAYSTATFPSALADVGRNPACVAAGELFVADFGTATRTTRTCRTFEVDIAFGMQMLMGPGGVNANQVCVGAKRLPSTYTVRWSEDADANTTTPTLPGFGTGTTFKHLCYTLSTTVGSRVCLYFPRLAVKNVPIQTSADNLNRFTIECEAACSTTTTSDLTLSAFRMGWA